MVEKKSLKPIPPTLRGKKRYIKVEFISAVDLNESEVRASIWSKFTRIFGEKGIAEQKLWLVKWIGQNKCIFRCSLENEDNVKTGLLFVKKIGEIRVNPCILAVSGSLKKIK